MADRTPPAADAANMAAVIERLAADLALAEEPSGFFVALDQAAPAREGGADA